MYQIICPVCNNANSFDTNGERPVECSFCFSDLDSSLPVTETTENEPGQISGLKLISQDTSEFIPVSGDHCIIGREHTGSEILSRIFFNGVPVISRRHCSFTFQDGKYMLKDEGSSNGTFYGVNKIDCSKEPQAVENNSIIFLGREAFLVQLQYKESAPPVVEEKKTETELEKEKHRYRCNEGCGFETDTWVEICPKCMTSNSLIEIT